MGNTDFLKPLKKEDIEYKVQMNIDKGYSLESLRDDLSDELTSFKESLFRLMVQVYLLLIKNFFISNKRLTLREMMQGKLAAIERDVLKKRVVIQNYKEQIRYIENKIAKGESDGRNK